MKGTFLDEIALGRYVAGDSPLHRANPACKAFVFTLAAIATFRFDSATAFLGLGCVLASLSIKCCLPQKLFWRSLRPVNILALFTILAGAFLNHPGASALAPSFSWTGLHSGGLYAARLVSITLMTTIFLLTTKPGAAVDLGIKLLKPLRLLGIEQQELSLLVHLAYRFVPLLRREIREMEMGRKARNLPSPTGFFSRLKSASNSLVYLFVGALKHAETTSFALEQRQVLNNWNSTSGDRETGLGGWMSLLIVTATAIFLWQDPSLL